VRSSMSMVATTPWAPNWSRKQDRPTDSPICPVDFDWLS
jgi:hypothetical protein